MPRLQRPPAWLARLVALLVACVLVGQSLLGSVELCALTAAFDSECCESPCADGGPHASAEESWAEQTATVLEATHGTDGDCSCPFDCALGCCSPNRALAHEAVALEHPLGESEQLALAGVDHAPPSPDARGILHVPKRAA